MSLAGPYTETLLTCAGHAIYTGNMDVHLDPDLEAKLIRMAAGQGRATDGHAVVLEGHRRGGAMLQTAAKYLGIAPAQIKRELQSGKTLAQLRAETWWPHLIRLP